MNSFFQDVSNNLGFVLICAAIIAGIGIAARLIEHLLPQLRQVSPARRVSIIGICAALATVLHILDFPLPFLAPTFYKLDFSEVPVLLAGFFLGPSATVACEGIKILLKLLLKGTSAIAGLALGTVAMAVFGSAFNAVYLLPKFSQLFHMSLDSIIAMGTDIFPGVNNVSSFVFFCVAPLNVVKGVLVSVLTMLLYKHVAAPLFHIREPQEKAGN